MYSLYLRSFLISAVRSYTERSNCPSIRSNWRKKTWRIHAFHQWITKQTETVHKTQQQSLCALWRSSVWPDKQHLISFPRTPSNSSTTGVQSSNEYCSSERWMDVREDTAMFRLPGLQKKSKGLVAAGGQVLHCRCNSYKLPHMHVWLTDNTVFWCTTSISGDIFVKLLMHQQCLYSVHNYDVIILWWLLHDD